MTDRKVHYQYPVEKFNLSQVKEGDLLALSENWNANGLVLEVDSEKSKLVILSRMFPRRDTWDNLIPQISEATHALKAGDDFYWTPGITTISSPCSVGYEEKNEQLREADL